MNLKEAFKIRKKDAESDNVIITIGNHLATEQVFKSEEEAQKVIDATDWNLVAAMIYACKEADQWEEKQKETLKKSKEFVINLTTKDLLHAADLCGVISGSKIVS